MHLGDKYVEIIGTVKDDLTLKTLLGFNMGDSLGECSSDPNHTIG